MKTESKIRFLLLAFLGAYLLIFLRLVWWQVVRADDLSAQAERQHFARLLIPARRGEIKTADDYLLAASKNTFLLYADLRKFSSSTEAASLAVAKILSEEIPLVATEGARVTAEDREKFRLNLEKTLSVRVGEQLRQEEAVWVNLAHFVERGAKEKIAGLGIAGLGFEEETGRDYPEASMAAHLLGFVGFNEAGEPKGYFGLEGYYDRELSGKPGEVRRERDALGRPIAIGEEVRRDRQDGRSLVLTLNRSIQRLVEEHLSQGIKTWRAGGGTAVVMDPATGAILAMASFPRYDPRSFFYYPQSLYKNPAAADLYEPGSIIKPLIMAAAINEDRVTPETRCDQCGGPRKIYETYIHTFDYQYHPNTTMTEVLINSDNTGMVFVGEKLGFDRLYSYLRRYGLGEKSGLDGEEEQGGTLRGKEQYYPVERATITFGQGISVNALQLMRAWAALANGGFLVTPHLVEKIVGGGREVALSWPKSERVLSEATSRVVAEMLVRVTAESPVHYPWERVRELARFRIAAKSGTAQIAVGGKYQEKGTIASVIGFFPADSPKFLVMVKLNEPEVRPWGSDTAGPVFFSILRDLVAYYGLTP